MKLAILTANDFSAWAARRHLLKHCVSCGMKVYLLTSPGPWTSRLSDLGVTVVPVRLQRHGTNVISDLRLFFSLWRFFRRERPSIVHSFTVKPNVYGTLAAWMARVPRIVGSVTGIGDMFASGDSCRRPWVKLVVRLLYKVAFVFADRVSFENPDDAEFFLRNGLVQQRQIVLVRGAGVDTSEFADSAVGLESRARLLTELRIPSGAVVVATVCRMLRTKGVEDFIEASELVCKSHPNVIFMLIGDAERGNPLSLSEAYLRSRAGDRLRWLGWRVDVRDLLSVCDIVVLLTRHREGVPGSLLEAMAMGKALVATDVPGCRETVEQGVNGYLVPPRAPTRAAEVISSLIGDEVRRRDFGAESRRKAERDFSVAQVNNALIAGLYQHMCGQ